VKAIAKTFDTGLSLFLAPCHFGNISARADAVRLLLLVHFCIFCHKRLQNRKRLCQNHDYKARYYISPECCTHINDNKMFCVEILHSGVREERDGNVGD